MEGPVGMVIADGGVGIDVAGSALHLAEGDTLEQPDGDVGTSQGVGVTR
ncbi:hypothetical protein BH24ACT15_BH24ACT15_31930 [soil metagenome]